MGWFLFEHCLTLVSMIRCEEEEEEDVAKRKNMGRRRCIDDAKLLRGKRWP